MVPECSNEFRGAQQVLCIEHVSTESSDISLRSSRIHHHDQSDSHLKRAILKNGDCNICQLHVYYQWLRFLKDPFTTLIDLQWRWSLLMFFMSYVVSWIVFSCLWWFVAAMYSQHGVDSSNRSKCYANFKGYTSSFLFSIEVQSTMAYSIRTITDQCPEATFLVIFQYICGVLQTSFVVGFLYAKITQGKYRMHTILFSKIAVICQRDGDLCLMFRIGDMRKSHFIGAKIRAQLIQSRLTRQGDILEVHHTELKVGTDCCSENLLFKWPEIICHKIDNTSLLYNLSPYDLVYQKFEIVIIFEGVTEATGNFMQARTSYLSDEIFWGRRFVSIVRYKGQHHVFNIDYGDFNKTEEVPSPACSAREWIQFRRSVNGTISLNKDQTNFV